MHDAGDDGHATGTTTDAAAETICECSERRRGRSQLYCRSHAERGWPVKKQRSHSFSNLIARTIGALFLLSCSMVVLGQVSASQTATDERKESAITGRVTTHEGEAL